VAALEGIAPCRVLDVGCGEGADAIYLAGLGFDVVALDVSSVALDRAALEAAAAGVEVTWLHAGLVEAALPPESFALVSAQYPALPATPPGVATAALLDAVAPGGHLLLVHHADFDADTMRAHGVDPDDFVSVDEVRAALHGDFEVLVDEERPRHVPHGAGAGHSVDRVLHARRRDGSL
jgi:SAM-dependent methyltransferase